MALPSVVPLMASPQELLRADALPRSLDPSTILLADDAELLLDYSGTTVRAHALSNPGGKPISVVLPLDRLFDVRIKAARRLWLSLQGCKSGHDPTALSVAQRNHLTNALRALDGRIDGATYREIAAALFGDARLPPRGWKTHDLRDRTIRLCRLGTDLMQGGYRQLLLYPYRQRLP